jgi:hypothetical protein
MLWSQTCLDCHLLCPWASSFLILMFSVPWGKWPQPHGSQGTMCRAPAPAQRRCSKSAHWLVILFFAVPSFP